MRLGIVTKLNPCTKTKLGAREAGFLRKAFQFQRRVILSWCSSAHVPCAREIIPPVNLEDETTNTGVAQNIL